MRTFSLSGWHYGGIRSQGIHWIRGAMLQKSLSLRVLACERVQDHPAEEGVGGEEDLTESEEELKSLLMKVKVERKRKALVFLG